MSDQNIQIAKSRIDKLRFILQIKNDQSIQVTDKTIEIIKNELTVDVYNNILKDNQLFLIIIILSNSNYVFKDNSKKTQCFNEIESLLFGQKFKNSWDYDMKMDFDTEGFRANFHELQLIKKILIKNLIITDDLITKILNLRSFHNVNGNNLLNDKYYIVTMILLSEYLNIPDKSHFYKRFEYIILNPDKKFITTITATAEKHSIKELEIIIQIYNQILQKKRDASITGGKKKTKYNIFMSKELKRLKKINPDKDYKLRFKEAVNNWKNKK